jgi:hypothetical protein
MNGCPPEEVLAGYADGTTAGEAIEAHLASCAKCRREVLDLQSRDPGPGAPPGLADRILKRAPRSEVKPMRLPYFVAAAAAVLIATFYFRATETPTPKPVPEVRIGGPRLVNAQASPTLGAERYLAHLSTDKPMYRAGERVYARAVLLEAFERTPLATPAWASFEIRSARGEVVAQGPSTSENSVAAFHWEVPQGQPGGQYTIVAKFPSQGYPDAEASFDVRSYRVSRLRSDLQFIKKAYGAGDEVTAVLSATRSEGGIPAGARVTAVATVDGAEVHRGELSLDAKGGATVTFKLPAEIRGGDGTLSMVIQDGGVQETAAKTIPIVASRLDLAFFPEGGDLVAGLESRVYFEARTPKGEPADASGRILDDAGKEAARFESTHEGRGRFAFAPAAGRRYRAVVDRPGGVKEPVALPDVLASGFSLAALEEVTASDKPVRVRLASPVATDASVGLYVKEKELVRGAVRLPAGAPVDVALAPMAPADGVVRVTVFDSEGKPRAERLVFRVPANSLRLEVKPDLDRTVPAGHVNVTVKATDDSGKAVRAVVGLSVVDDAVLESVDRRDRAPRLPVQALLGAEVKELKDAAAYLGDGPKTDLLLGTQGWRRFALVDAAKFIAQQGMAGRRVLAHRVPVVVNALVFALGEAEGDAGAVFGFKAPPAEARPRGPLAGAEFELAANFRNGFRARELGGKKAKLELDARHRIAALEEQMQDRAPAWVRLYAHQPPPGRVEGQRTDFTETVYWNAGLLTDEKGEATFGFHVSDSITTFRVRADGFAKNGALGEADRAIEVRRPFYAEPKFPLEVTAGDQIDLPVALVNGTAGALDVQLDSTVGKGLRIVEGDHWKNSIAAEKSLRAVLPIAVEPHQGEVELRLRAQAGPHQDEVTRKIAVVPAGFPIEINHGGLLEVIARHEVTIPQGVEPGSLVTEGAVYPSPLASLTQALAALLREPGGCFEQTSSSNYPNVMALQYLKGHAGVDAELVRRASELADRGYQRLVSFECRQKGYEWFGQDPGHEALTAYGVMEFLDMSRVMSVDQGMIDRTRAWILSRRDGKGSFLRDSKALDTFGGAPQDITDAYILWALTEAGEKGLDKEVAALRERALKSEDPYLLALAAVVLLNSGDRAAAGGLLDKVAAMQKADGSIPGAKTSITRSGGESLEIETASLAILGWLRSPKHTANTEKAMRWLTERCKSGRFGATQSTILALKAIIAYDAAHARPKKAGKVTLKVDGQAASEYAFPADQQGPILIGDFAPALAPGKHVLELGMEGGADMPYSIQIKYHARTPASSDRCKVGLRTSLSRAEVGEGESVDVSVEVKNRTEEGLPMVTAVVGLPGGLEARADRLKELVRAGKVDAFETRGREVVLYWRGMAPRAVNALTLSAVAAVPGRYTGPASRAYLYYTDEHKDWQPGLGVKITRR